MPNNAPKYGWREFFTDWGLVTSVGGGVVVVITTILWFINIIPTTWTVGIVAFSLGAVFVGLFGHAAIAAREPLLRLGRLWDESSFTQTRNRATRRHVGKPKAQANIVMLGAPRMTRVHCDDNFVFREHVGSLSTPHRLAIVQDFQNKLEAGRQIETVRGVMSQLTVTDIPREMSHLVNRGFWLGEKYTSTDFGRGDTRTLLIAFPIKADVQAVFLGLDPDTPTIEVINNRCESEEKRDSPQPWQFSTPEPLRVSIVLFTQSKQQFYKEGELELKLGKDSFDLKITKPLT